MSKQIKERWELECVDVSSPLVLTSALDPRFRQLIFIKLNDFKKEELKEKIVEYMEKFKKELKDQNEASQMSTEPPEKKKKSALDVLLGPEQTSSVSSVTDELTQYLSETPSPRNHSPLLWWKINAERFPNLAPVARVLLSIPATSTPSERVFSTAGNTVTKLRSCLKPKNVDALIFLNINSKKLQ